MKKLKDNPRLRLALIALLAGSVFPLSSFAESKPAVLKLLYGDDLRVAGPLDRVDSRSNVLIIAGQAVVFDSSTRFVSVVNGRKVARSIVLVPHLKVGEYLAVTGGVDAPALSITEINDRYIAGADTVYVKGELDSVSAQSGVGKVGGLSIDLTPAMSDASVTDIQAGSLVEVSGTQPVLNGVLLAESIVGTSAARSIVGTSSLRSIVGTSSSHSIVGTSAAKSIVGTSAAKSIVGTSAAQSIVGTSLAKSIVGTSATKSIVGTSATKSIVGTSATKSIVGTSAAKSIVGTSAAESIVGTSAAKSIVGTSATKSIVGTSLAKSIVGTSMANSIVGTSAAKSIVGTSAAKSIVGTSLAKSIVGASGAN